MSYERLCPSPTGHALLGLPEKRGRKGSSQAMPDKGAAIHCTHAALDGCGAESTRYTGPYFCSRISASSGLVLGIEGGETDLFLDTFRFFLHPFSLFYFFLLLSVPATNNGPVSAALASALASVHTKYAGLASSRSRRNSAARAARLRGPVVLASNSQE